MLKNKKEREEYINNSENWEVIGTMSGLVGLYKLKKTNIYKVMKKHFNSYYGPIWTNDNIYLEIDNPVNGIKRTLGKTELLEYLKELKN